ncbi:MAG TPA: chorismate mutase [Polaromonas sp.]|uniref:chorismate mutase n=1 Tax=Polaromonas sp. TaxID=1869339 RepID=UPI002D2BB8E5|nr:chorismate mutase [Polaromonas sp.]HYW58473.1 chorismate mutase [Polaromonas sp.]
MSHNLLSVARCESMTEVRQHIDALDDRIVALLAERSAYVAQAARIKPSADKIVDHPRIEFIIDRVRRQAREAGAPEPVIEAAYRALIAASIDFERVEFARIREGAAS